MPVPVTKTYKLHVGGKFPRSESGRTYRPAGNERCNVARASRKDLRDAVAAARAGLVPWNAASAYLRGQILYRIAEMLEARRDAMLAELTVGGTSRAAARKELDVALALATFYAGMCDKLQSLLGSQNAVAGPFFCFSTVEPTGVVGIVAPERPALSGLLALLLPPLCAGNTVVAVVAEAAPFAGLALGEVLVSSDVPPGAVNLLSGPRSELAAQLAAHRDVDGLFVAGRPDPALSAAAADNLKRVRCVDPAPGDWTRPERMRGLAWVEPFAEAKTFWHPIAP